MDQFIPIISLIIVIPLLAFWLWMFQDMVNNKRLPSNSAGLLNWPPVSKFDWLPVFIFLNVFGAIYYYLVEFRNRA